MHAELLAYSAAKVACTDVPSYNGHLVHPRSNEQLNILDNFMLAAGAVTQIFIGVEQTDSAAADSKTTGWYYTTPNKSSEQATFLPWTPTEPDGGTGSNNVVYIRASRSFSDVSATPARAFLCVYDDIVSDDITYSLKIVNLAPQLYAFDQIAQISQASLAKCTRECRINQACASFAYSSSTMTCQLLASSYSDGNFSLATSFVIYARLSP
uniref:Apple domain-containing protein n=1 Tax=Plectus sambesii TaxID=2011161 RepID=A0A914WZD3_9BILA